MLLAGSAAGVPDETHAPRWFLRCIRVLLHLLGQSDAQADPDSNGDANDDQQPDREDPRRPLLGCRRHVAARSLLLPLALMFGRRRGALAVEGVLRGTGTRVVVVVVPVHRGGGHRSSSSRCRDGGRFWFLAPPRRGLEESLPAGSGLPLGEARLLLVLVVAIAGVASVVCRLRAGRRSPVLRWVHVSVRAGVPSRGRGLANPVSALRSVPAPVSGSVVCRITS